VERAVPVDRDVVKMDMNLETKLIGAGPSERSGEIDLEVTIPISYHPRFIQQKPESVILCTPTFTLITN
jgi:hypothetical protein